MPCAEQGPKGVSGGGRRLGGVGSMGAGREKGQGVLRDAADVGTRPMGAGSLGRKGSAHLGAASGRRGSSSAASVLYRGLLCPSPTRPGRGLGSASHTPRVPSRRAPLSLSAVLGLSGLRAVGPPPASARVLCRRPPLGPRRRQAAPGQGPALSSAPPAEARHCPWAARGRDGRPG